jgi:hypothetical protein
MDRGGLGMGGVEDAPVAGAENDKSPRIREPALAAADAFMEAVLEAPWGSISKNEIDLLIFTLLVDSKKVGKEASDFNIADLLSITPARVRTLRFRYDQRVVRTDPASLASMMVPANFSFGMTKEVDVLDVTIHRMYLRHYFVAQLEARRSMTYERTPSVLSINRQEFVRIVVDAVAGSSWAESESGQEAYLELFAELVNSKNEAEAQLAATRLIRGVPRVVAAISDGSGTEKAISSLFARLFGYST